MEKAFNKWCEKLLDTGRGNRLINFKDSMLRTVDVLAPDSSEVLKRITNGEKLSFYDIDTYVEKINEKSHNSSLLEKVKVDKLSKNKITNEISKNLTKKQILAYKQDIKLSKLLKNINKISQEYITEKGINILYITFGLLCWTVNNEVYNSPLVLIPISLINDAQENAYKINEYEDDVFTNPTLIYKLKNEMNLELPEFRQEGHDEENLAEYLVRVQLYVENNNNWFVKDEMKIGTFSFLKLDMYKDLKNNETQILKNKNIQKLLNKPDPLIEDIFYDNEKEESIEIDNTDIELKLNNVVDADSSQMNAIMHAKSGESFVLQGPPGTGKSQTITNLIAEFLNDGKKILFVSEKLAALKVVFNNLKKVGLSDYCLELHSNKTNKKEVIAELYRMLNLNEKTLDANATHVIDELANNKKQLDDYAEFLHKKLDGIENTPFEILSIISELENTKTFEYIFDNIGKKDLKYIQDSLETIKIFAGYTESIGYNYKQNPWYGYVNLDHSYKTKIELKKTLTELISYFDKLSIFVKILNNKLSLNIKSLQDLDKYMELIRFIGNVKFFDNNIFISNNLVRLISQIKTYLENRKVYEENKAKVLANYTEEIFKLDVKAYYNAYRNKYDNWYRFLNKNYKRDKGVVKKYQKDQSQKLKFDIVIESLKNACDAVSIKGHLDLIEREIFNILKQEKDISKTYDWRMIYNELLQLKEVLSVDIIAFKNITESDFDEVKQDIDTFFDYYYENKQKRMDLEVLQNSFDTQEVKFYTMEFDSVKNKFEVCLKNYEKLENWSRFVAVLEKIDNLKLREFIDLSIVNNINRNTLDKTFNAMFYLQYMYYVIENNEILGDFSRYKQDYAVENFKSNDKLKFEISKAKIISQISKHMPNINSIASGSQVSTLVREANKKIKQKPVRVLLKEIGELVQKLKPCFLMSPLSVSTYLDMNSCDFDVVIFDEASQIFPWDAVGAIARAKQTIVVGDSKQMPPSNFFNATISESEELSEEEEEDDSLDFESILDLSSAVFNQHRLNWHYRSKTEELIAFSNANFYENSLVTFPSAFKNRDDMGVDFYYVSDGVFDRKRKTNEIEAKKVVDLVFEHFKTYPNRSLGVVAFSISQQSAIEDEIQIRREQYPEFEKFFDSSLVEPFFVKNLETVQGDERDTIIFSVAYAKDSTGRFIHNFGPLNKKGGERRLNVAVTRAKYNVKLVSSITSLDIDLNKSSARGTMLLKEYLRCAEHGIEIEKSVDLTATNAQIEEEIYKYLLTKGFSVVKNIGCSKYKIDFGVKHSNDTDFVVAVECDGENYKKAKTTRDRDRLRQEVLERLGWKYYRIWSIDWLLNKEIEKEKLINFINKSIADYDENIKKNEQTSTNQILEEQKESFIVENPIEKKDLSELFDKYEIFDINSKAYPTFDNCIVDIVKMEAPITEELLLKRTVPLFGREKITSHIRSKFSKEISRFSYQIFNIDDYYVVDKNMMVKLRVPKQGDEPRDIMHISNVELSSGMYVLIQNSVGITKNGLFNTIVNLLGYTRIGTNMQQKLEDSLGILLNKNLVKFVDGEYFVNN